MYTKQNNKFFRRQHNIEHRTQIKEQIGKSMLKLKFLFINECYRMKMDTTEYKKLDT